MKMLLKKFKNKNKIAAIKDIFLMMIAIRKQLTLWFTYFCRVVRYALFPSYCTYCRIFLFHKSVFCSRCFSMIQPIVSKDIVITKKYTMKVFALSAYKEPIKSLILAKGWSDIIASKQLGELIGDMTALKYHYFDYIIPIPSHWTRYAWRGFNQAEEIANIIAHKSGKPKVTIVKRRKRTAFQASLSKKERLLNVRNIFTLRSQNDCYRNKHLLLVDDLMTTSATLQSAARVLCDLKPASVTAVVACRVI